MSILRDDTTSVNPVAEQSQAAAENFAPQSPHRHGLTLGQLAAGAASLRAVLAARRAAETPDPSWTPAEVESWRRIRARKEREAERASRRAAAAEAALLAVPVCTSPAELDRRISGYLDRTPGGIQGQGGSNHTLGVCGRVIRGYDLTPEQAYPHLARWNLERCVPPWPEHDLRRKIEHAHQTDHPSDPGPRGWLLRQRFDAPVRAVEPGPTPAEVDAILAAAETAPSPPKPCPFKPHFDVGNYCPRTTCVHKVGRQGTDQAGKHRWQVHRCDEYRCDACNPRRAQRDYQHLANLVAVFERDADAQKGTLAVGLFEPAKRATVQRDLNRKCCQYARVLTTASIDRFDASPGGDVRSKPMGDGTNTPDTTASDIGVDQTRAARVLVLAHVPASSALPVGFERVDPEEAVRIGGTALMSVPTETDAKRYEPVSFSRGWKRPNDPPSDYVPVAKSEYTAAEAATAARQCGLDVKSKRSRSPRVQGRYTEVSGPPILCWVFGRLLDTSSPGTLIPDVPTAFRRLRPVLLPTMRPGPATRHVLDPVLWSGPQPETPELLDLATDLDTRAVGGVREWVLARLVNTDGIDLGEAADRFREWSAHLPQDIEASCLVRDLVGPRLLDGPTATMREDIVRRSELEAEADGLVAGLREQGRRSGNYRKWLRAQPEWVRLVLGTKGKKKPRGKRNERATQAEASQTGREAEAATAA